MMLKRGVRFLLLLSLLGIISVIPLLPLPLYVFHVIIILFFNAYLCTAWVIIGGFAKQVSLGHSTFVGIGAYSVGVLLHLFNLTPIIGGIVGVLMTVGVAFTLGYPCFRFGVRGPYFTFVTMALAEVMYYVVVSLRGITGGALGIFIPWGAISPLLLLNKKLVGYCIIVVMFFFAVFLARKIQYSKFGYYLTAIREDEDAAEACGVDILKYKLVALSLSAALTALGGAFYAIYYSYITPDGVLGLTLSFQMATMSLAGGAKFWFGPAVGALLITPFTETVRSMLGGRFVGVPMLLYGVLLLIVARVAPDGVSGFISSLLGRGGSAGNTESYERH